MYLVFLYNFDLTHEQWLSDPTKLCGPIPTDLHLEEVMLEQLRRFPVFRLFHENIIKNYPVILLNCFIMVSLIYNSLNTLSLK